MTATEHKTSLCTESAGRFGVDFFGCCHCRWRGDRHRLPLKFAGNDTERARVAALVARDIKAHERAVGVA